MVAHIRTVAFLGVDAISVDVKAHLAPGQKLRGQGSPTPPARYFAEPDTPGEP